jgi:hypothetical protein
MRGQATIEYLVIISVVVVVSLVVVGTITGVISNSGSEFSATTSKTLAASSSIALQDSIYSPDGNYLLRIQNNLPEVITITQVIIGDKNSTFLESFSQGSSRNFIVTSEESCLLGNKINKTVKIVYTSSAGLSKVQQFPSDIIFSCENYIVRDGVAQASTPQSIVPASEKSVYFSSTADFSTGNWNFFDVTSMRPNTELDWNSLDTLKSWKDSNLTRYYKFNNSSNIGLDSTDNNNGTCSTCPLWVNGGNVGLGGAVNFVSGKGMNIPDVNISGNYSVSFWMHFPMPAWGWTGCRVILTGTGNPVMVCTEEKLAVYNNGFYHSPYIVTPLKGWHYITSVGSGSQTSFYVDGVYVSNVNTKISGSNAVINFVGNNPGALDGGYSGWMDELRIYNKALTATEISRDYNRYLYMDSNYVSRIIDTNPQTGTTDYNYLIINTNNGADKNGHLYGRQIEPTLEKDLNEGLVGLWHFNGDSTDLGPYSYGGNGNNISYSTGLWGNQQAIFNGTSSYVSTTYTQNVTAYTVSVWIKTTDTDGIIISNRGVTGSTGKSLMLNLESSGKIKFHLNSDDITIGLISTNAINDGNWHHVAGSWSAPSGSAITASQFALYVDGNLTSTTTVSIGSTTSPAIGRETLNIGKDGFLGNYYAGSMQELAIWNRALDSNTIIDLFNKGASNIGVKYRSCESSTSCTRTWSDMNYMSTISLDSIDGNRYMQYSLYPTLYQFPNTAYMVNSVPKINDVNIVYVN